MRNRGTLLPVELNKDSRPGFSCARVISLSGIAGLLFSRLHATLVPCFQRVSAARPARDVSLLSWRGRHYFEAGLIYFLKLRQLGCI